MKEGDLEMALYYELGDEIPEGVKDQVVGVDPKVEGRNDRSPDHSGDPSGRVIG